MRGDVTQLCYRPPLVSARLFHILVLATACQTRSSESAPARPDAIEVQVGGEVTARVSPGHPCRATIDGQELLVGGRPLIAQVGAVRWTGDDAVNGTMLKHDGTPAARIVDDKPGTLGLYDPSGIPLIRATLDADGKRATVSDRAGVVVRYIVRAPGKLTVQPVGAGPAPTITGTDDLLLAAALTATEALSEVRGLAACHRLFPIEKAP